MSESRFCSRCGESLAADAPAGVCPRCVLQLGMESGSLPPHGSRDPGPTTPGGSHFTPPPVEDLQRHFPQLEIIELLGRGGMGAVYKARQPALDRLVALKILPPEVGRDPHFADRFTREARALAKLSHPNIVMVYDFGHSDGLYFLVMEFVDGTNLRTLMQGSAIQPAEALAIVPQICEALQFAHDEGIVHRDIKPENILVDKKGRVKIADFGLAKLVGAATSLPQLTGTYQVMGTFHYMAPEQFERPQEVDHRADIYSLGVVLYELLTHELPIGRFSLPSQKARIDVRLDEVVLRALEKEPPRRYQHASDIKTAVDTIVREPQLPPVAVAPSALPPAQRAISLPIKIDNLWGGFAEGHGMLRFDGEELLVEFDLRENVFQAIRFGTYQAQLSLDDISALDFEPGWWAHTLRLQASRFQTLARLPGCDRGQLKFTVSGEDRPLAEKFVAAVNARLAGESWIAALAKAESAVQASAATEIAETAGESESTGARAPLFAGVAMVFAALLLLALAVRATFTGSNQLHAYLWPGVGLLIGGGGALSAGLKSLRGRAKRQPEEGKPENVSAQRDLALRQAAWPGFGLLLASAGDLLSLPGLVCGVGYLVWNYGPPPSMLWAYAAALLAVRLSCAPLQIVAARNMRRLENRPLAVLGSFIALIPGSPAWLLGLPMGLWAWATLRKPNVQEAFQARGGNSRAARPWPIAAPMLAASCAGLGLVIWTYATAPQVAANPGGDWVTQVNGPEISQELASRLELRPAQVQAINDVLQSRTTEYREIEASHARIISHTVQPPSSGSAKGPRGYVGQVRVKIGPFATRLARLESHTLSQIDLVLDERQRGLIRQYNLLSDLFPAGRQCVILEIEGNRPGALTPEAANTGPQNRFDRPRYSWTMERQSWFSNETQWNGGNNLPLKLQAYWDRAAQI